MWKESAKIELSLQGLKAELPMGSNLIAYRRFPGERYRVDGLAHIASYYGIARKIVNIGNYEARRPFFAIYFKEGLGPWPSLYQIECRPEAIDWNLYPNIEFLLGVNIREEDKIELSKFFSIIFENERTTVWRRL